MIRIAAVGDLHFGPDLAGSLRPHLEDLPDQADMLLLAGDLTRVGDPEEARALADELRGASFPIVAVLGNHDYQSDQEAAVRSAMEAVGVRVLDGSGEVLQVDGTTVGVCGVKGFGGGFVGASGSDFGEQEMKAFVHHSREQANRLEEALRTVQADVRVALMHYSPVESTLQGERLEIYPFLGSYYLAEAVDRAGAALALHGHAHRGSEKGVTPGGVHVRNVAQTVIRRAYTVYCIETNG